MQILHLHNVPRLKKPLQLMYLSFNNLRNKQIYKSCSNRSVQPKTRIYGDNLSAIFIWDNLLPIIVITYSSFDLSITDIAFVIYSVIADKLS